MTVAAASLSAQGFQAGGPAPFVVRLEPPAAVRGETVRMRLRGSYLDQVDGLLFSHAEIRARRAEPATASGGSGKGEAEAKKDGGAPLQDWEITVGASVPAGLYDLRAYNARGVSAPRAFHVSSLRIVADRDPTGGQAVDLELGARCAGVIEKGDVEQFRLRAPRDARVVVECFAERIDSQLDAVLEVRSAEGRSLAFSSDRNGADPALVFDAKAGGDYVIELWDLAYEGSFPYLISVSTQPRLLAAFPQSLRQDRETEVTFYGWNLPGGVPVDGRTPDGAKEPLEALALRLPPPPADAGARSLAAPRATVLLSRGLVEASPPGIDCEPLLLALSALAPLVEKEPNDRSEDATALGTLAAPFEVWGRFDREWDQDWFTFRAEKDQALEISVDSAALGAPCDPVLLIAQSERRKEKVKRADGGEEDVERVRLRELLYLEDRQAPFDRDSGLGRRYVFGRRDPRALWKAPADGEYLVKVRSAGGGHGLTAAWRLRVDPAAPSFDLVVLHGDHHWGEGLTAPRGGSQGYEVLVERRGGFEGVVEVRAEGLPEGVECAPVFLGPGESCAALAFSARADAADWTGQVRVWGRARVDGRTLDVPAASAATVYGLRETRHPFSYVHSRFTGILPLLVRDAAPFAAKLKPPAGGAAPLVAVPGTKVSLEVEVERRGDFGGAVAIAYHGLGEKAFANENGERPAKTTMAKEKKTDRVELTVPAKAGYGEHSVVAYASSELEFPEDLSNPKAKKRKLRATFVSNPVTVKVVPPVEVEVQPPAGALALGGSLRIPFKVRRLAGVDAPVEVRLDLRGEKKGLSAKEVKLQKGEAAGQFEITSEIESSTEPLRDLSVTAKLSFAGRNFEYTVPLAFAIEREPPFGLVLVDAGKWGSLGFDLRRPQALASKSLTVSFAIVAPEGVKQVIDVAFREGEQHATVNADCSSFLKAWIEKHSGAAATGLPFFPMRVRVEAAWGKTRLAQDFVVGTPGGGNLRVARFAK
jgi:hypothetical protein